MSWTDIDSLPYTISSGGNYHLTGNLTNNAGIAITISAANVVLDGQTYTLTDSVTNNYGIFVNANNVEIYGLNVVGPNDHSGGSCCGIYINDDKTNVDIHDCTFDKWYDGVYYKAGTADFTAEDLDFTNCTSHNIKAYVSDNFIFQNITCTGGQYGLTAQNCTNWHFYDCTVANATEWSYINDGGGSTYTIERCTCSGGNGYYTDGGASGFTVRDCTFDGGANGTRIEDASDFTLLHVTVSNNTTFGFWTLGTTNTFTIYGCTMTGNSVGAGFYNASSGFELKYSTKSGNGNSNNNFFVDCTDYDTTLEGTAEPAIATPTFNPVADIYNAAQNVEISCTQTSATIYYTTDGSAPDAGDTAYTVPINVAATTTVKAIALELNYPDSDVASAEYVINAAIASILIKPGYWFG